MASKVNSWYIFHPDQGGFRGVVRGKSNNTLAPGQCSDMYNYLSNGGPVKRPGNTIDNAVELVANTKISGLFQFFDGTNYKTFAKCGTQVFDVAMVGASTPILSGLAAEDEVQFLSWFSRYFITDGKNLYSGTTGSASVVSLKDENGNEITGTKPHGKSILLHKERLWLTRDPNFPTRVYFSLVDFYDRFFTDGGPNVQAWVHCEKDDGQPITGFALYNDKIFVTKREKHYWITGEPTDTGAGNLSVSAPYPGGAYDQKTIVNCPDGFIRWWGPDGVYQYSDATGYHHISDNIDYELKKILDVNKSKACAQFYDNYYVLMFPDGICEYADGFAFDIRTGEWYPIRNWNISCMAKFADDTLHAGFYDRGYVCQLFNGNVDNVDMEDIECYAKTRIEKPPGPSYKAYEYCLDKLQVYGVKNGQSFTLYWNAGGDYPASGSWSFTFNASGDFLGEFMLGDANIPDDGSLLISVDDLIGIVANPWTRPDNPGSQRFRNIYFEIFEKGPAPHGFDFLQIDSYLLGEVR